jgi:hypothetical protein
MIAEMAKYGTLENPFSVEYIDDLLSDAGFVEIERYISVNGLFTEKQSKRRLREFSSRPIIGSNNMTARRPTVEGEIYPNCYNFQFRTDARLSLLSGGIDPVKRTASIVVKLENTGETLLDSRIDNIGHITFSLRQSAPGHPQFVECEKRQALPKNLVPGESLNVSLEFTLPDNLTLENWELDLISETVFWFSTQGIPACAIPSV